jgi:hypothetical protein
LRRKLFEDNAKKLLDNRNYEVMMDEYQAEQTTLTAKLQEINTELKKRGLRREY